MAAKRPTYIHHLPPPGEIDVTNRPAVLTQIIRWTERRDWYPQPHPSTTNPIIQSILQIRREAISLLGRHKPGIIPIHLRRLREDIGEEVDLPDWGERLTGGEGKEEGEEFEEKMINYLLVKLLETCRARAADVCRTKGVEGMMADGFGVGVDVMEMLERRGVDEKGVGVNVHPAEQGQGGGLPMKKNVVMVDGFEVDWEEMMKGTWVPAEMRDGRLVPVGEGVQERLAQTGTAQAPAAQSQPRDRARQIQLSQTRPPPQTHPARNPAVGDSRGGGFPARDLPHRPRKEGADRLANNDGARTNTRAKGKVEGRGNGNLGCEIPVIDSPMFEASVTESPVPGDSVYKTDVEAELFLKLRFKPKPAVQPRFSIPVDGGPGAVSNEPETPAEDDSCWMNFDAKENSLSQQPATPEPDDSPETPPEADNCWMDFDLKEKSLAHYLPTASGTDVELPTSTPAPATYRQPYVEDASDSDTDTQSQRQSRVIMPSKEDGGLPTPSSTPVPAVSDEPPDPPDETRDDRSGNPKVISITDIFTMLEELSLLASTGKTNAEDEIAEEVSMSNQQETPEDDASLLVPTEVDTDVKDEIEEEVLPENRPEPPPNPKEDDSVPQPPPTSDSPATPTTPTPDPDKTPKSQHRWSTPSPSLPLLSPTDLLALASTPVPLIPFSSRKHLLPSPHPRSKRTKINRSLLRSVILLRTDYTPPCTPSSPCPQIPITPTSTHELQKSLDLANKALADATRARRPRLVAKCHLQRGFVLRRMERWGEAYGDFVRAACIRTFAGDEGREGMLAVMEECLRGMGRERGERDEVLEVPEVRMGLMRQGTFGSEVVREGEEEEMAPQETIEEEREGAQAGETSRWSYSVDSPVPDQEQVDGAGSPVPGSTYSLLQRRTLKNGRKKEIPAVNTSHWSYSVNSQTAEDETRSPSSQPSRFPNPAMVEKKKMNPLLASRLAALRVFGPFPGREQIKAEPSIGAKAKETINHTSQQTVPTADVSRQQQLQNEVEDPSSPGARYQDHFSNLNEYTGSTTSSESDVTPIPNHAPRAQNNTTPTSHNPQSFSTWQIIHSAPNLDEIDWLTSGASHLPPSSPTPAKQKQLELRTFYIRDAAGQIVPSLKSPPALRSVRGRKFQLKSHGTVK